MRTERYDEAFRSFANVPRNQSFNVIFAACSEIDTKLNLESPNVKRGGT
jgi:hypothetical protein